MKVWTLPIVGSGFHPPARQVLSVLPLGIGLELVAESTNEYDPNAVRVLVDMKEFPEPKLPLLKAVLDHTSFSAEQLRIEGPLMLGYLPKSGNKTALGGYGNVEVLLAASAQEWGLMALKCQLTALVDGSPGIHIEIPG